MRFLTHVKPKVEYNDIMFYIKPFFDEIRCPVCLEDPSPPVVTKCGHVYCWKCIIHCILVKNKTRNAACPLCACVLTTEDVRIVVWRHIKQPVVNQEVKMNLCVRNSRHCYISLANDENKLISTSLEEGLYEKSPGIWFIHDEKREEILNHILACPLNSENMMIFLEKLMDFIISNRSDHEEEEGDEDRFCEKAILLILNSLEKAKKLLFKKVDFKIPNQMRINKRFQVDFYQMLLGYNIFLHPKSFEQIRDYLFKEGKSNLESPVDIKGKVVSLTQMRATSKVTQKYAYLNHLPDNSHFTFCLLELTEPSIPLEFDSLESIEEIYSDGASEEENPYIYNSKSEGDYSYLTSMIGFENLSFYLFH